MALNINIQTKYDEIKGMQRHERITTLKTRTFATLGRDDNNNIIMDSRLYEAAKNGDVDSFIDALEDISITTEQHVEKIILNHLSPSGNTLLHVAASGGRYDVVEEIIRHFPGHVGRKNSVGDTPLHFACRGGWSSVSNLMVKDGIIIGEDNDGNDCSMSIFREKNQYGNTALHDAVLNQHVNVVRFLVNRDPEIRFYQNEEGKCPLYLAVEVGDMDIFRILCDVSSGSSCTNDEEDNLVEKYRIGLSPIHAAIKHRKLDMLKVLVNKMPQLISTRDENGGNPLHYASFMGDLDGLCFILDKRTSLPLQRDQNGFYPLHIACQNGDVKIIQKLLSLWPDPTELHNNKGQNILHVASKHGKDEAVKYLLKDPKLQKIVNEKDSDGNTPSHLATICCHPKVLLALTRDDRVDLKIVNKELLTALDLALDRSRTLTTSRMLIIRAILVSAGAPRSQDLKLHFPKFRDLIGRKPSYSQPADWIKDRVNTRLLVATLIATVTFAAGFTPPGGYDDTGGTNKGMATLIHEIMFHVFVICNTLAMYTSIVVVVILLWAQLDDFYIAASAYTFAVPLLGVALTCMSLAFLVGVYSAVWQLTWLGSFILVMGILFLLVIEVLYLALIFPLSPTQRHMRRIAHYLIMVLIPISESYGKIVHHERHDEWLEVDDYKIKES